MDFRFLETAATVDEARQQLLNTGRRALSAADGDRTAKLHREDFRQISLECSQIFPDDIFTDIITEVTCRLRLDYGKILADWLFDTGKAQNFFNTSPAIN